jgi:hypothetical protein
MTSYSGYTGKFESFQLTPDASGQGTITLTSSPTSDQSLAVVSQTSGKDVGVVSRSGSELTLQINNCLAIVACASGTTTAVANVPSAANTILVWSQGDAYNNSGFVTGANNLKVNNNTVSVIAHSLALTASGLSGIAQSVPFQQSWMGTGYVGNATVSVTDSVLTENIKTGIIVFNTAYPTAGTVDLQCIYS